MVLALVAQELIDLHRTNDSTALPRLEKVTDNVSDGVANSKTVTL